MPNSVPVAALGLPIEATTQPSALSSGGVDRQVWSSAMAAMLDLKARFESAFTAECDSETRAQAEALFKRLDAAQKVLISLPAPDAEALREKLSIFREVVWGYTCENPEDADYFLFREVEFDVIRFTNRGVVRDLGINPSETRQ